MARGSKTSKSVKVNFKDVETRRTPAEGDYLLRVQEATKEKSGNNNDQIKLIFQVDAGDYKGANLYLYCPLTDNSLWKLASVLEALGMEVPQDELNIDLDELVDKKMMGVVHHETHNGRKQAKLGDWAAASEYKGDDADDGKKSKKKDKDKKGSKSDKKDDKKDAGKKDKAGGKDKKGDGKKDKKSKKETVTIADDASEKDLKKLAKKHGVELDLDGVKPKKIVATARDAFEAAGFNVD